MEKRGSGGMLSGDDVITWEDRLASSIWRNGRLTDAIRQSEAVSQCSSTITYTTFRMRLI